jgi:hypothetical protein
MIFVLSAAGGVAKKQVRNKSLNRSKDVPQGLKPNVFWSHCGTTEVVP